MVAPRLSRLNVVADGLEGRSTSRSGRTTRRKIATATQRAYNAIRRRGQGAGRSAPDR